MIRDSLFLLATAGLYGTQALWNLLNAQPVAGLLMLLFALSNICLALIIGGWK